MRLFLAAREVMTHGKLNTSNTSRSPSGRPAALDNLPSSGEPILSLVFATLPSGDTT